MLRLADKNFNILPYYSLKWRNSKSLCTFSKLQCLESIIGLDGLHVNPVKCIDYVMILCHVFNLFKLTDWSQH